MDELEIAERRLISSTTLLSRTGLSRATLNNYIKMGMIPPPIIKKPNDPNSKAKRIGYFEGFVVDVIKNIKMHKKERRTMNEIVSLLSLKDDNGLIRKNDPGTIGNGLTLAVSQKNVQGHSSFSEDKIPGREPHGDAERPPEIVSFSVLVAGLQDSLRICAELSPEEYFMLIQQIARHNETSYKKYSGTHGKYACNSMVYYFLKDADSDYLKNTIHCALEFKESMMVISNEWKKKKGWSNELHLNIGINEGEEYFGTISAVPKNEFISFGASADCAACLSKIAHSGSILTTKNLINRLDGVERRKILYGIRHDPRESNILIEGVFSRIMELIPPNALDFTNLRDFATLSVTEVINLR